MHEQDGTPVFRFASSLHRVQFEEEPAHCAHLEAHSDFYKGVGVRSEILILDSFKISREANG